MSLNEFYKKIGENASNVLQRMGEESFVKKAMMKNADKIYYLCDSSKMNKKYMYNICSTDDVTGLINEGVVK